MVTTTTTTLNIEHPQFERWERNLCALL